MAAAADWKTCWQGRPRLTAVRRGLDYIQRLSYAGTNFSDFGNDTIQVFYDVAKVSGWGAESLRRRCPRHSANDNKSCRLFSTSIC